MRIYKSGSDLTSQSLRRLWIQKPNIICPTHNGDFNNAHNNVKNARLSVNSPGINAKRTSNNKSKMFEICYEIHMKTNTEYIRLPSTVLR